MHPLEAKLARNWPPSCWQDVSVLVAVSGGPDSVGLLRAMRALKTAGAGRLLAAHFNHGWRGAESDADEQFVRGLCAQLGIHCEVGRADPEQAVRLGGTGLEARARVARYSFLETAAARLGARWVVTAHTADDQAETILHRIVRGTGIAGLAGMARSRPFGPAALIRPLLGVRRAELLAYLEDLGQPFRSDSSNTDARFTRNRLRTRLLPTLAADYNPAVVDALLRLGQLAREVQSVIDQLVDQVACKAVVHGPDGQLRIARHSLVGQPRYVVRELLIATWRRQGWPLRAMRFDQWDLLAEMALCAGCVGLIPEKRMFPGGILAEVTAEHLQLKPAEAPARQEPDSPDRPQRP